MSTEIVQTGLTPGQALLDQLQAYGPIEYTEALSDRFVGRESHGIIARVIRRALGGFDSEYLPEGRHAMRGVALSLTNTVGFLPKHTDLHLTRYIQRSLRERTEKAPGTKLSREEFLALGTESEISRQLSDSGDTMISATKLLTPNAAEQRLVLGGIVLAHHFTLAASQTPELAGMYDSTSLDAAQRIIRDAKEAIEFRNELMADDPILVPKLDAFEVPR